MLETFKGMKQMHPDLMLNLVHGAFNFYQGTGLVDPTFLETVLLIFKNSEKTDAELHRELKTYLSDNISQTYEDYPDFLDQIKKSLDILA